MYYIQASQPELGDPTNPPSPSPPEPIGPPEGREYINSVIVELLKLKATMRFKTVFDGFQPGDPSIYVNKGVFTLHIPFTHIQGIPRQAEMVYDIYTLCPYTWASKFNPFESIPQPHESNGIEWIRLTYLQIEPNFSAFAKDISNSFDLYLNKKSLLYSKNGTC